MSLLFYRSSTDGWRLGVGEVNNTTKVLVTDVQLRLQETCRPSDTYVPDANHERLLRMSSYPEEFLAKDDAALMVPTPLVAVPAVIQLLRHRCASGKPFVSVGDGMDVIVSRRGAGADDDSKTWSASLETLASKVVLSHCASGKPQVVCVSGRTYHATLKILSMAMANLLSATAVQKQRLEAAFIVLSAFTTTLRGENRVIRQLSFQIPNKDRLNGIAFQHTMLDTRHFGTVDGCSDNFRIFAMMIYGFNSEEKERVFMSRKQTDFQTLRAIKDMDEISDIRAMYVEFTHSFETLGIEFSQRLSIFGRMSAILHLQEIDFFDDGSPSNLTAVKSVARLLQLDFNAATKIFRSKEVCITVARWLYEAVLLKLCEKVNTVCSGGEYSTAAITVVSLPPPPSAEENSAHLRPVDLPLATLYEDLAQCLFRTSELEAVNWQRSGLRVSDALQSILDQADNFGVLKLLRGRGGLLHLAQMPRASDEDEIARKNVFHGLHKSKLVDCSVADELITVRHTFGPRTYNFSCRPLASSPATAGASSSPTTTSATRGSAVLAHSCDTIHADRFTEVREFLFANADVETQEAIYLLDQRRDPLQNRCAEQISSLKPLVEILQSDQHLFWCVRGVGLEVGFPGDDVEAQLQENGLLPIVLLRRHLPQRFIPCQPSYLCTTYAKLLKPSSRSLEPLLQAESIASDASVRYLVTPEKILLIEGHMLVNLQGVLQSVLGRAATLVQSFARVVSSRRLIRTRLTAWTEAVTALEAQRADVVANYRAAVQSTELHKMQCYELCEKEAAARILLRDQSWVEWVALQTDAQQHLEVLIQRMVARSIRKEESTIKKSVSVSHRNAVQQLADRIQQRLLSQGSNLDRVIHDKEVKHAAAYRRLEKEYETHKRIMTKKIEEEENKLELKQSLAAKQARLMKLNAQREQQREELRQKLWFRHEKDRLAKQQMEKTRQAIAIHTEEQLVFDEIERKVAKRVEAEVVEEQRRIREAQEAAIREAKRQREEQLVLAAKANERQVVKQEILQRKREEAEANRKRKLELELLQAQERERRAMERIQREENRHQKDLTRSLLKAHDLLQTPVLFEHTAQGTVQLVKHGRLSSRSRSPVQPFVLSNGKETHPRLFSESVAAQLVQSHHSSPRPGSTGPTTAMSARQSSVKRNRDASPASNFSI